MSLVHWTGFNGRKRKLFLAFWSSAVGAVAVAGVEGVVAAVEGVDSPSARTTTDARL